MMRLASRTIPLVLVGLLLCSLAISGPAFSQRPNIQQQSGKPQQSGISKPARSSSATKSNSFNQKYSIRGFVAQRSFTKQSISSTYKAMVRAGMKFTHHKKHGQQHTAFKLRERGPQEGIHNLQQLCRVLSRATPNYGIYKGERHAYYRITRNTYLTVNSRNQIRSYHYNPDFANRLRW